MIATKEFATGVPNIEEWNWQELGHFFEVVFSTCVKLPWAIEM